jgi:hypothetical protein
VLEVSRRQQQREQGGEDYPNIEAHREEPLAPEHWELRLAVQTQIVSMAGVRLECRKSIELSPGNLRLSPRTFQAYRDSSLPKLKPRSFPAHESNGTSGCRTLLATGNFSDSQPYVSDMPLTLLEIKTAFGPEDTAAMTAAFEEALKRLNVADREAPMATSLKKSSVWRRRANAIRHA